MNQSVKEIQIGPRKFVLLNQEFEQIVLQVRNEDNKVTDEIMLTTAELTNLSMAIVGN